MKKSLMEWYDDESRFLRGGSWRDSLDWTIGDVIHAHEDGTIILDDGITTWNPIRAADYFLGCALARLETHENLNLRYLDHVREQIVAARQTLTQAREDADRG